MNLIESEKMRLVDEVKNAENILDLLKYHYYNKVLINNPDTVDGMWRDVFKILKNVRGDLS